ncbi:MAG TPA: type 4a pilus biogenesis protein PilO, partial [Thermoanaerobaculia bacterium]|nr:type 4a pilus biogenesis protein PilO [Thermoanaerobaculia bacterium]
WYVGLGVGVGVAVVLFALAWWRLYGPMKQSIAGQDAKLAELQGKIQEGRAAKQRLPQFREEVRRLELELDKLLRILPARLNTEDLLRRLRALAEQGDLDILRITPGNLTDQDFYSEWPIQIGLHGTYHNLALFFDRIGRFSRIINIDDLVVDAIDPSGNQGHSINAAFTAKTFVYREEEEEVPAAAAPAAPAPGAAPPPVKRPGSGSAPEG